MKYFVLFEALEYIEIWNIDLFRINQIIIKKYIYN